MTQIATHPGKVLTLKYLLHSICHIHSSPIQCSPCCFHSSMCGSNPECFSLTFWYPDSVAYFLHPFGPGSFHFIIVNKLHFPEKFFTYLCFDVTTPTFTLCIKKLLVMPILTFCVGGNGCLQGWHELCCFALADSQFMLCVFVSGFFVFWCLLRVVTKQTKKTRTRGHASHLTRQFLKF